MKIALDATPLTAASGGIRRYTEELSRALAETFPDEAFWLLSDRGFELPARAPGNLRIGGGPRNALERKWWLAGLPRELSRLGVDLFHGTDFSVPYLPLRPSVMTLHDLSPWMNPGWHAQADRVRRRTPRLLRLGLAGMLITHSEAVRRQAIERFSLAPDRVVGVPLAAAAMFRSTPVAPPARPYLLYTGTLEPRKNLSLLLEIWREARQDNTLDLVLAGRRRDDFPEIPPEPGLRQLGLTPDEDLPKLISGALACVYPSCYEGFGLPVLEAMQCGAAVIASRDPAIAEVAGSAAILADVRDHRAWLDAVRSVLRNAELVSALRAKSLARAAEFSWPKTARLTREVYEQAAQLFRKKT
jgi:glycosyltransferase involved in cell wall biosynthesis